EAHGCSACECGGCGISIPVAVGVGIPGVLHAFVDAVDAVVVDEVADLGGTRVDGVGHVVAVAAVGHVPHGTHACCECVCGVAVAIVVGVCVPGGRGSGPLVDAVDAIVVDHVADLGGARVHGHRRVVAVRAVGDIAHRGLAGDERVDKVA